MCFGFDCLFMDFANFDFFPFLFSSELWVYFEETRVGGNGSISTAALCKTDPTFSLAQCTMSTMHPSSPPSPPSPSQFVSQSEFFWFLFLMWKRETAILSTSPPTSLSEFFKIYPSIYWRIWIKTIETIQSSNVNRLSLSRSKSVNGLEMHRSTCWSIWFFLIVCNRAWFLNQRFQ